MTVNIVCTSKPCDGLLFYSYEYCSLLNSHNIKSNLVIIPHRKFTTDDYLGSISKKYIHSKNIYFNNFEPKKDDISLVMGRSMISLAFQDFKSYSAEQQASLKLLFSAKLIAVYSENHPIVYPKAIDFFNPTQIVDLCDTEVYPNGVGDHFEKRIHFGIYQTPREDTQFEYLFLGTNKKYYETVEQHINKYPDHGILTYKDNFVNPKNNNIFVPTNNLLGIFNTFVYTKSTFDPAPRIVQECRFFNKNMIYERDTSLIDGGHFYWKRPCKEPDIQPVINAIEKLKKKHWTSIALSTLRRHYDSL